MKELRKKERKIQRMKRVAGKVIDRVRAWKLSTKLLCLIYLFTVLFYTVMALCPPAADFYMKTIYTRSSFLWEKLTGTLPFSVAEWCIASAVVLLVLGLLAVLGLLLLQWIWKAGRKFLKPLAKLYVMYILWLGAVVGLLLSMHWFVMYRYSSFSDKYLVEGSREDQVLVDLFSACVMELNRLDQEIARDASGYFILNSDLNAEAQQAMQRMGEFYPELSGYYPNAKPLYFSYFMSQSGTTGVFLPLFVEANYNVDVVGAQLPFIVCHELAHVKGIIQEEEANLVGILACIHSESIEFQYSGYLNLYQYLLGDADEMAKAYQDLFWEADALVSANVKKDAYRYFSENYWEENKDQSILPTEWVNDAQTVIYDTTLQLNGVEDGIRSYQRVVACMMDFYEMHEGLLYEE